MIPIEHILTYLLKHKRNRRAASADFVTLRLQSVQTSANLNRTRAIELAAGRSKIWNDNTTGRRVNMQ